MPSSIRPTRDSSPRIRVVPEEVVIVDWPLRDRPLPASLALTLAAGASWLAAWATNRPAAGGAVAALLALTLWRTLLPVHYQLGAGGVVQSILGWRRQVAWQAIRRCELHSDGVELFPDTGASPLAPLQGIYVHWGTQREAVLAQLEYFVPDRFCAASGAAPITPKSEDASPHER